MFAFYKRLHNAGAELHSALIFCQYVLKAQSSAHLSLFCAEQ